MDVSEKENGTIARSDNYNNGGSFAYSAVIFHHTTMSKPAAATSVSDLLQLSIQQRGSSVSEFADLLNDSYKISPTKFIFLRLLTAHCILNIFEFFDPNGNGSCSKTDASQRTDNLSKVLAKQQAYDCYIIYFRLFYRPDMDKLGEDKLRNTEAASSEFLNVAGFGKLIKSLYGGKVESRRIGGRQTAKYCYSNLSIKKSALQKLKQNGVNVITDENIDDYQVSKKVPVAEVANASEISNDNNALNIMRSAFKSFLENDILLFYEQSKSCHRIGNNKIDRIIETLDRSEMLFNNFIHSTFNEKSNLDMMCKEWDELDVISIIKESLNFNLESNTTLLYDLVTLLDNFKLIFQAKLVIFTEDLVYKYFKMHSVYHELRKDQRVGDCEFSDVDEIALLKQNITQFLLKIVSMFQKSLESDLLLHFKFISTEILRKLTINKKSSFSSYWIFSCFADEYFNFLIESSLYYSRTAHPQKLSFKKPKLVNRGT